MNRLYKSTLETILDKNHMKENMNPDLNKDIIGTTIKSHAPEISSRFKADVIGIFGSYARGEQHSGSDVDVLVRFHKGATLLNLVGLSDYLEKELGVPVDVVSEKALHPMMRDDVMDELVMV